MWCPWDPLCNFFEPPMVLLRDNIVLRLKRMAMVKWEVKKMTISMEDLKTKRRSVEAEIKDGTRKQMTSTPEADHWLQKVKEVIAEVITVEDQFENRRCFLLEDCSMNCYLSLQIGERAANLHERVVSLKTEVDSFPWVRPSPPDPIHEMFSSFKVVVSTTMQSHVDKVRSYLRDDNVRMVGIWGMGGVGKTTLLKKINNSFLEGRILGYDFVVYVAAKRNDTVKNLQSDLVTRLDLSPKMGQSAADSISMFLRHKNFLLLIDDLWEAVDLTDVGIPIFINGQQKHKVVITTRFDVVCAKMNVPPDKRISVECLKPDEAMDLFKETVGDVIDRHPNLSKLAKDAANKCSGLPMAIVHVGQSLSTVESPGEWENMLKPMTKLQSSFFQDMEEKVLLTLELTYDHLKNDTLQQCFLCCSFWPAGYMDINDLIECWIHLGLIRDFNDGPVIIGKLKKACLLEHDDVDGDKFVKMHDVTRELALWIISKSEQYRGRWYEEANVAVKSVIVKQNVGKMTASLGDLKAKWTSVEMAIEDGTRKLFKKSTPEADCWLKKVEEVVTDGNRVQDQFANMGSFLLEDCSVNCSSSLRIGEEAADLHQRAVSLKMEVHTFAWVMRSGPESIQQISFRSKVAETGTVKSRIRMVRGYLRDDNVRMVGIWGMGGVGKTTLLKKINNSFLDEESLGFDYVIYVTAKRNHTVKNLQSDLISRLDLSPKKGQSAAESIFMYLKQKNILLLIDDLWEEVALTDVGIPVFNNGGQQKKNCKVVITTRFKDVCARMHIPPDKWITVECLKPDEAMELFKETVGEVIDDNPTLRELSEYVVKKSSWLPMGIVHFGQALGTVETPGEWENMLRAMTEPESSFRRAAEVKVLRTLELTYDHLEDDRLKKCFLCCSFWPDGYMDINDLIECWTDLGLVHDFHGGSTIVVKLKNVCLLEPDDVNGDKFVKMHDVARELASSIISNREQYKGGWYEKADLVVKSVIAKQNVKKMIAAMEELIAKRTSVETAIADGKRKQMKSTPEADRWLEEVKEVVNSGSSLLEDLSPRVTKEAAELYKRAVNLKMEVDSFAWVVRLGPVSIEQMFFPSNLVSRTLESQVDQVRDYLGDDNVSMVGIWGLGGVGKTTLLKMINNSLLHDESLGFEYVIYVAAERNDTAKNLQSDFATKLGLDLPSPKDVESAADRISLFLDQKNFLLLIDDLWGEIDLKTVGIPVFSSSQHKSKVVIATRSEDVCAAMYIPITARIRVQCLKQDEAMDLFRQTVGEVINKHPELRPFEKEVVKNCSYLPMAIVVIGKALSTKETLQGWVNMLKAMTKPQSTFLPDLEEKILPTLELSYENLQDHILQECFLCCSFWPDERIDINELIECWMGLGLIRDFAEIHEAYDRGDTIIRRLKEACLLEEDDVDKDKFVKMHNVVRQLALWIVSNHEQYKRRWYVKANLGLTSVLDSVESWGSAELVSLMKNKITVVRNFGDASRQNSICPVLSTFILRQNQSLRSIYHGFFQYAAKLSYLDLSYSNIRWLPRDIGNLYELQHLDLSYTPISSLPDELRNQRKLKYLLLRHMRQLKTVPIELISSLSSLQVLYVFPYTEIDCKGFQQLRRLKAFSMAFRSPDTLKKLRGVPMRNLGIYVMKEMSHLKIDHSYFKKSCLEKLEIESCHSLEKLEIEPEEEFSRLAKFYLRDLWKLQEISFVHSIPGKCLQRLSAIEIEHCNRLRSISWIKQLPCLVKLCLKNCSMMEIIAEVEKDEMDLAFKSLRDMRLEGLPILHSICNEILTFPVLESVVVLRCPLLNKLPFKSQTANHNKLRKIRGSKEWLEDLQWEDKTTEDSFLPYFREL